MSRGKYELHPHGEGGKGCTPSVHAIVEGLLHTNMWGRVAPNAASAQSMTKKHSPWVQHRPFPPSCPAPHPAPGA